MSKRMGTEGKGKKAKGSQILQAWSPGKLHQETTASHSIVPPKGLAPFPSLIRDWIVEGRSGK